MLWRSWNDKYNNINYGGGYGFAGNHRWCLPMFSNCWILIGQYKELYMNASIVTWQKKNPLPRLPRLRHPPPLFRLMSRSGSSCFCDVLLHRQVVPPLPSPSQAALPRSPVGLDSRAIPRPEAECPVGRTTNRISQLRRDASRQMFAGRSLEILRVYYESTIQNITIFGHDLCPAFTPCVLKHNLFREAKIEASGAL